MVQTRLSIALTLAVAAAAIAPIVARPTPPSPPEGNSPASETNRWPYHQFLHTGNGARISVTEEPGTEHKRTLRTTTVHMQTHPDYHTTEINLMPITKDFSVESDSNRKMHVVNVPAQRGQNVIVHLEHKPGDNVNLRYHGYHWHADGDETYGNSMLVNDHLDRDHLVRIQTLEANSISRVKTTIKMNHPPGYQLPPNLVPHNLHALVPHRTSPGSHTSASGNHDSNKSIPLASRML